MSCELRIRIERMGLMPRPFGCPSASLMSLMLRRRARSVSMRSRSSAFSVLPSRKSGPGITFSVCVPGACSGVGSM